MGNRAVIAFENKPEAAGIYLHWNGGIESVLAFTQAAKDMQARSPNGDSSYAMAGLVRAITLFIHSRAGELLSMGVDTLQNLDTDNFDNGLYIIDGEWNVKERLFTNDTTKTVDELNERQREQYNSMREFILECHVLLCEHHAKS